MALRIAAIFAVPMALIMLVPLLAAGLVWHHETQARLRDDRELIARVNQERIERARAINQFIYKQCLESEVRDVVIVQQLRAAIKRVRLTMPAGPVAQQQIQTLKDGIAVLEPANEPDCMPPPAVKQTKGMP